MKYRTIYRLFAPLVKALWRIEGVGTENIPETGAILAANHTAFSDVLVISAAAGRKVRYMAKKELFATPLAPLILALGAYPVDRRGSDVSSIRKTIALVEKGELVGIFPQGHRQGGKDWIQFTAPISSGSSGGALLNDEGKVIGITTATYASTQNINMAVRATAVQRLYDAWDGRTLRSMGGRKGNAVTPTAGQQGKKDGQTVTVYVGRSGKKYHNTPTCSGMQNAVEMDLLEAIGRGYEPCGKCYK